MLNTRGGNALILLLLVAICSAFQYSPRRLVTSPSSLYGTLHSAIVTSESFSPDKTKERLDTYLAQAFPQFSRSYLSDLCEKGKVEVNSKIQKTKSFKVSAGDTVSIDVEIVTPDTTVVPECIPLDILYEDEHIIAVNKPKGMVVHPAPGSPNGTFVNALLYHLGPLAQNLLKNESVFSSNVDDEDIEELDLPETPEAAKASPVSLRPGIVHRLDKGTSGVLLAGKHPEAVAKLSALFSKREIKKIYMAIAIGHPGEATIVNPIGRSMKNRQLMTVYDGPPGKAAITHVKTIAFDSKLSAVLVRIETGRTHQIRVHLKERRTPIAGDEAYGNPEWNKKLGKSDGVDRPLLHAYETCFVHPFTNKEIKLQAPIPSDMTNLMKKLTVQSQSLIDPATNLLTVTTDVKGKEPGEKGKGYIPYDRLQFEEDSWVTDNLLPVDDE